MGKGKQVRKEGAEVGGKKGSLLIRNDTNDENMSDNSQAAELALLHVVQAWCHSHWR